MRTIRLTQNKRMAVDNFDFELLSEISWHSDQRKNTCYARAWIGGEHIFVQNFLLNPPKNMMVDHKSGNGLDNRRCNLRICTRSENGVNKKTKPYGTSKYRGVFKVRDGSWIAQIGFQGDRYFLGTFYSEEEAARKYDLIALDLYGDFASTNFDYSQQVGLT